MSEEPPASDEATAADDRAEHGDETEAGGWSEPDDEEAHEEVDPLAWSSGLRGLREITSCRATLSGLERALVRTARSEGAVWAEIAATLGVTKQTALRRHRADDPVAGALARARAADPWLQELAAIRTLARGERAERPERPR